MQSDKSLKPWCDRSYRVYSIFIHHKLPKGSSNGYVWDAAIGPLPDPDELPAKKLEEWSLGRNVLVVYCMINSVLYKTDEIAAEWRPTASPLWVNFRTEGGRYTVSISLDGVGRDAESKLHVV